MKAVILGISLAFAAQLVSVRAQDQNPKSFQVTPELLTQLAEEALTNNAAMQAYRARVKAAEHHERSIPLFKDPEIMAGGMAAERMMREEDGDVMFGVEQELPVFGKEKAARKVATAEKTMQEAEYTYEFQSLRKEIAIALLKAAEADELLTVAERDLEWLNTTVETTLRSYEVGEATQVDVLRVQNDRARRQELLTNEINMRYDAYVTVNRLLFRPIGAPWPRMRLPELAGEVKYSPRLLEFAEKYEPRILALRKEVERDRAMANMTRLERRPDLMVGAQSRIYSGKSDYRSTEAFLKLSIPLFNSKKYKHAQRRDEARAEGTELMLEDYIKGVREEVHHLITRMDNARREALLYRDEIIPRSEQALAAAEAAWQSGGGMFRDVLDMRRMLLESRTMYLRAVAEQWMSMSELVLCCGLADLEALMTFEQMENSAAKQEEKE